MGCVGVWVCVCGCEYVIWVHTSECPCVEMLGACVCMCVLMCLGVWTNSSTKNANSTILSLHTFPLTKAFKAANKGMASSLVTTGESIDLRWFVHVAK